MIGLGVAAAAMLAGAGLATADQANAGTTGPSASGYVAGGNGWTYRYAQADVRLPDITSATFLAAIPGGYGSSVRFADGNQVADLGISTTPGSGNYNAAFAQENSDGKTYGTGSCLNGKSPLLSPGDTVRLELYYNPVSGVVSYSAADLTNPVNSKGVSNTFSGTCSDPGQKFTSAGFVDGFTVNDYDTATAIKVNGEHSLTTFTNTVITNRTGIRGSIGSSPWPVSKIVVPGTTVGHPWGSGKISPDNVVRTGRNFSVLLGS